MPKPKKHDPSQDDSDASSVSLYDVIMCLIEPDLMSNAVGGLDEKYAGESPNDREDRLSSYDKAFVIFEKVLVDLEDMTVQDMKHVQQHIHADLERKEQSEQAGALSDIEGKMNTSSDL